MQSIWINNKHDEKLAAYLFLPEREPRFFLIICHGFRGAKENGGRIFQFARRVNDLGGGVLAFDFSGSGASEGDYARMTLTRQADDLRSVIDYLADGYDLPLVLLGRSFGGSTVIAGGAAEPRVAAYILWSTPIFMTKTFAAMIPEQYKDLQAGQIVHIYDEAGDYELESGFIRDLAQHNMDQYLLAMSAKPVLIIHARDDEIVTVENAQYVNSKLSRAGLHIIDEAGHRFLEKTGFREKLTLDWLEKTIDEI